MWTFITDFLTLETTRFKILLKLNKGMRKVNFYFRYVWQYELTKRGVGRGAAMVAALYTHVSGVRGKNELTLGILKLSNSYQ